MATLLELGPIGQMVGVHTYNHKTLGFRIPDQTAQDKAIQNLTAAANKLASHFPWIAGQVVNVGASSTSSGTFRVVEYPPHEGPSKFLYVKDCRNALQPYDTILKAKAPASMLPGHVLSSDFGFPNFYPSAIGMPVLKMQVNLLEGGILLSICAQHNVMDANGDSRLIGYFARLCAGGDLTSEELAWGNIDRNTLFPSISAEKDLDKLEWLRIPSMLPFDPKPWPPQYGDAPWRYFRIPASSIAALKGMASSQTSEVQANVDSTVKPWFSTDDLMTAFLWKHMVRSRSLDLDSTTQTGLIRAVNGRARCSPPITSGYLGHMVTCIYTHIPLSGLFTMPLREIALALRKTMLEKATPQHMRSLVHLMRTTEDKTTINYGASMNPVTDVMITSHTAHGIYEADFGEESGLGLPDIVRRPNLPDGRCIVYMLPKGRDGSVDVVTSLDEGEVKTLREGEGCEEWNELVEYIG
ncbi:hypothetical protein K491DRAFT_699672 [Lophiostoma macrostomum CBS 122681]|uniref:Trichothecene 3-O-acetyltransferase-like N-terminal domain-containing protein n=1 Tax=Lophiostoma macrostomum CBS 122681 TaxID=1314788 RepID=A0A6A6SMI1_9PLEO|nr:hypothetical protein K491DRAFT_699672 [Lophiostoma macrostomum CBS 122681]